MSDDILAVLHELEQMDWPACINCGSEETVVVPKTGEWSCENCGRQWHSDETRVDDGDAEDIPGGIGKGVETLFTTLGGESDE